MQTLAFLWYELKAAKRHVKEAVAECQEIGKADFSLLNRPSDSDLIDEGPQRRRHRSLRRIAKKEPGDPTAKMVAFSVAGFGIFGSLPVFWTLPTAFLSGAAAAGGIAIINSIGNLAGFVGPSVMGMIKDATRSFTNGLLALVGVAVVALIIVLSLRHDTALERLPVLETSRTE